jgi:ATP adenylyltransferase
MNKLWSPWRSEYIDSFKNDEESKGCIFCEAAKQDIEDLTNLLVNKGNLTFTLLNLYPYNNGHLMVVPFRHTEDFFSLTTKENEEIMGKIQLACRALKKVLKPEGFNVGLNLGKAAGAGIHEHIHFHVVPRWNGDTNFMPALGEVKIISQDLLVTKKNLLEVYKQLMQE